MYSGYLRTSKGAVGAPRRYVSQETLRCLQQDTDKLESVKTLLLQARARSHEDGRWSATGWSIKNLLVRVLCWRQETAGCEEMLAGFCHSSESNAT
eukprot:4803492-Amphidinium_carterae.1